MGCLVSKPYPWVTLYRSQAEREDAYHLEHNAKVTKIPGVATLLTLKWRVDLHASPAKAWSGRTWRAACS